MNDKRKIHEDIPHWLPSSEEIMKGLANESKFNLAAHHGKVILGTDCTKILAKFNKNEIGGNQNGQ